MLKEIRCAHFSHRTITFHPGLNVILGDDDAKNSIGKSTMLMVIDFVLGGKSFLDDHAGAIRELKHHHYDFSFQFGNERLFFSRQTDEPGRVYICDESYTRTGELQTEDYNKQLKRLYGWDDIEGTFRSSLNPFARIWGKGCLEPDEPFASVPKEPAADAVNRLIDLFGRSSDIAAEREVQDKQKERRSLINKSASAGFIPKITKTKHAENIKTIDLNREKIDQLKRGLSGALSVYESLFDDNLRKKRQRKNELITQQSDLQNKIKRLNREISGITPRLAANIALLADYFPTLDLTRLEQVEAFHQKIGSIVKRELKEELEAANTEEAVVANEISAIDLEIQESLQAKGMPDDIFNSAFELKESTDQAVEENRHFKQNAELDEAIKLSNARLKSIYTTIFIDIESRINIKLKAFNRVVYGPSRASSELRIRSEKSYQFTSTADTGTGKSYAGLIGFDLAMLSLTKLPLFIHDSIIYKNIEVSAVQRTLRILSAIKLKQVFLSFDEAKKFGTDAERLLRSRTVLKLGHNDLLYKNDWRAQK